MTSKTIKSISLIIPVYNEEKTLAQLLEAVAKADFGDIKKEIIIINDSSQDTSLDIAEKFAKKHKSEKIKFQILSNDKNLGKSQTVKRGILKSTGDLVVVQDADLEYEPSELKLFVDLFKEDENLDAVYGNRFGKDNKVVYWQNWIGNRFLTFVSNLFTIFNKLWLSDMEVCYKMIRGDIARDIANTLESTSNFGIEPEVTAKLAKYVKTNENKNSHLKFE